MNLGASPEDIHFSAVFSNNYSQNLELPRDKKDLVQITIPKKLTPSGVPITNPTTELGPFCRAAEAAGLLGQVLELVSLSSGSDPISEQQSRSLDHSLQELAMSLLQQATNGWDECCAAIGICFRYFLISKILFLAYVLISKCDIFSSHEDMATRIRR